MIFNNLIRNQKLDDKGILFSDSFPMFREISFDESQNLQQTYQAWLDHCENSYRNFDTLDKKNEYEQCINSIETQC
ncbi:MAG: hypothetical protein OEY10_03710 [Nitrosopumilus sp.]|nr:hypothetical protein [Nitrosopumilus sp.]